MKKWLSLLLTGLLALALTALPATAETVGDYVFKAETGAIKDYVGPGGDVVVPVDTYRPGEVAPVRTKSWPTTSAEAGRLSPVPLKYAPTALAIAVLIAPSSAVRALVSAAEIADAIAFST